MRYLFAAASFCLAAAPALAGDDHVISEERLRALSDADYITLVVGAAQVGRTYTPEQIASGLKRHYQEWRARIVDAGFSVVPSQGS